MENKHSEKKCEALSINELIDDVEQTMNYASDVSQGAGPYEQVRNFELVIKNQRQLFRLLKELLKQKGNELCR